MSINHLSTKCRIALADDHAVVRDGIKAILERSGLGFSIVGEAGTGKEILDLARTTAVDVFILDLEMPELDGIETLNRLNKVSGGARVVFLSMYDEKSRVEQAIRSGARGYILKDSAADDIVNAVQAVHKGGFYFSPKISGYLAEDFRDYLGKKGSRASRTMLTDRQIEVVKRICRGMTEKQIAQQLDISPNTVHVHINNIMKKTQAQTRAGLIKYAIKTGLVQL